MNRPNESTINGPLGYQAGVDCIPVRAPCHLGDLLIVSEFPRKRQSPTVAYSRRMNKERKEGTHERCTAL